MRRACSGLSVCFVQRGEGSITEVTWFLLDASLPSDFKQIPKRPRGKDLRAER